MEHKCRYCGLCFLSKRKKYDHIHLMHSTELPIPGTSWNKGKTKETCETIKKMAIKISESNKGSKNHFYGKHHTEDTKKKLARHGGYRIGSGYGKKGWYKGYYCDSSWELAFVMYNLDHGILFERNTKKFSYIFNNKKHYYIPDWIIDNKFIEIKGYWSKQWQAKLDQFPNSLSLKIISKKDIVPYIEYAENKYGKNFISQYDNYKGNKETIRVKKNSMTIKELNNRKNLIINSGVDLSKYGCISKLSRIIGLSKRQIYLTIKYCPDLNYKK